MNCIVCIACVPDTASVIKIAPDGKHIDETGIKWIVSPYDEYALEEALKIGADAVSIHVNIGNDYENEMLEDFGRVAVHRVLRLRVVGLE